MMPSPRPRISRLVSRLTAALALFVALAPVSIFGFSVYFSVARNLDSNLRVQAFAMEKAISAQPDYWDANTERLRTSYERYVTPGESFHVLNKEGKTIVEIGPDVAWHTLVRSHPLHDFGREVGRVAAGVSVFNFALLGLIVLCTSLCAAWLIWGPLRRIPLAALAEAEARLLRRDQYQRALLDNFPFMVWLKDKNGRFLATNSRFAECLGQHSSESLIGKSAADLVPDDFAAVYGMNDNGVLQTGLPSRREERVDSHGGHRWFEIYQAPVFLPSGEPLGTVGYAQDTTERQQAEVEIRATKNRLRAVLNGVQSGVIAITEQGIVESFNPSAERIFGYCAAEVVGNNVSMLMPAPYRAEHDSYLDNYRRSGTGKIIGRRVEYMAQRKDGSTFPIELGVTETQLDDKKLFIGSMSDITFRKEAEAELRIAATAFQSQEGMMVTDAAGVILRVNPAFTDSTGYTAEEAIGQPLRMLESGRHDKEFYACMWETVSRTGRWQGEVWDRHKNGEVYPKWLTISAVKDAEGAVTHYICTNFDITERKKAEQKIEELAFYDQLTGLPNRILLLDRLKHAMTVNARSGNYGALLFIDLDNFKTLNDTLGHDMGDRLLKQVAQRLTSCLRAGDTVARLGGDEFVVMLASLRMSEGDAATQAEAVGEKILASLNQTYQLANVAYRITPSIGATLFRGQLATADDLMKQADLAMYKSKAAGRNALHFFDPEMEVAVMYRAALEADLREAVNEKQFVLHYQAQVVGGEGRLTGAEALVRWKHPKRGMVSPAEFIPLAEETGLILALGNWVLETACAQLALWAARPEMAHLTVAVNVSAKQFRDAGFVDTVLAVIGQTGANPQRLKLELTESLLVDNVQDTIEKMFALKARGVGFSLDDFGTGYSSLSYLKRLPLDQLKIDQSFVRDLLTDSHGAAIARTIVALAHSLGLGVIAEGVETEAQRDFLAGSGCHAYQGYFFSRPLPIDGFEQFAQQD